MVKDLSHRDGAVVKGSLAAPLSFSETCWRGPLVRRHSGESGKRTNTVLF